MRRVGTFLAIVFAVGAAGFAISGSAGRSLTLLVAGVVALMLAASDSIVEMEPLVEQSHMR